MNRKTLSAVMLVAGASCGGGTTAPTVVGTTAPTGGCVPTSIAAYDATTIQVFDIDDACAAKLVATHRIIDDEPALEGQAVFGVAWPRRDGAMVVAIGSADDGGPTTLRRLSAPRLADGGTSTELDAPAAGEPEPEGFTFAVAADDTTAYVERCASWDSHCDECEEVEEWDCTEHLYVPIDGGDPTTLPPDRFAVPFARGTVPGTRIVLTPDAEGALRCQDGDAAPADEPLYAPFLDRASPPTFVVVPLSSTTFLFGTDSAGHRMRGWRAVDWQLVRGCTVDPAAGGVAIGPDGYWAAAPYANDVVGAWGLRRGADPGVEIVDAAGAPLRLDVGGIIWTR